MILVEIQKEDHLYPKIIKLLKNTNILLEIREAWTIVAQLLSKERNYFSLPMQQRIEPPNAPNNNFLIFNLFILSPTLNITGGR